MRNRSPVSYTPTPAEALARVRALDVRLKGDLDGRTGYPRERISRVLHEHDSSAPILRAVWLALDAIEAERQEEDERLAAAGDRAAMNRLDRAAATSTQTA